MRRKSLVCAAVCTSFALVALAAWSIFGLRPLARIGPPIQPTERSETLASESREIALDPSPSTSTAPGAVETRGTPTSGRELCWGIVQDQSGSALEGVEVSWSAISVASSLVIEDGCIVHTASQSTAADTVR